MARGAQQSSKLIMRSSTLPTRSKTMQVYHTDYLYSTEIGTIDNSSLYDYCLEVEKIIIKNHPVDQTGMYGSASSAAYLNYNILTFPNIDLNKLYHELTQTISPFLLDEHCYMIQSWLNVFRKGQRIDWHRHWPAKSKCWHGFYCVETGNDGESGTEYKIPGRNDTVFVTSKNGRLVFGKSEEDSHRSTEWMRDEINRVTIAFDIVPLFSIPKNTKYNHYIPFKSFGV